MNCRLLLLFYSVFAVVRISPMIAMIIPAVAKIAQWFGMSCTV